MIQQTMQACTQYSTNVDNERELQIEIQNVINYVIHNNYYK